MIPSQKSELTGDPSQVAAPAFAPTRWTLVVRARGKTIEAQTALSELCENYYNPVLSFLRREGRTGEAARELAQEFFARVLAGSGFDGADADRGRFRSYLLGALKHFLADARLRSQRQKRGGGGTPESLDAAGDHDEPAGLRMADLNAEQPDASFDRQWALEVMKRTLDALEAEMASKHKIRQFSVLKPWLMGDVPALSQAGAARELAMTEGAVKVAVHRLRKRFGELIREELAQTLRDPAQAGEELAHLIAALS